MKKLFSVSLSAAVLLCHTSVVAGNNPVGAGPELAVKARNTDLSEGGGIKWDVLDQPVFSDPDDNVAKDPSILYENGKYYMFYTGALPGFQGPGTQWQLEYATSTDAIHWKKEGILFKADDDTWEAGRVQAPSRPVFHNGLWYMFYSGGPRKPKNIIYTGYATSKDLIHWKKAGQILQDVERANDIFIYKEGDEFLMFYTTYRGGGNEPIFMRRSKDLINWSSPEPTGAKGEGTIVWKEGETYFLLACTGYSGKGEVYRLHSSSRLGGFNDHGVVNMEIPAFASDSFGHGDILKKGEEIWLYFQGTNNGGKGFQVGLAKHKIPR